MLSIVYTWQFVFFYNGFMSKYYKKTKTWRIVLAKTDFYKSHYISYNGFLQDVFLIQQNKPVKIELYFVFVCNITGYC